MPKIKYIDKKFSKVSSARILQAEKIIDEYQSAGLELTLRQLYYQFVARDLIPNSDSEYKKLGVTVSDARLNGLIDWYAIVDRTRSLRSNPHWNTPADILEAAADSYAIDKWREQKTRCEVWIEKDALIGVIERPCSSLDVPYFSCRGYTSQSEMWVAALRIRRANEKHNCKTIIFHFGDHDPSGIDMTRDIQDRLTLLSGKAAIKVKRIALNMDQIEKYKPPPNPTKVTDSRAHDYIKKYGSDSWELDALEPTVLNDLVTKNILRIRDKKKYTKYKNREDKQRLRLKKIAGKV